MTGKNNMWGTKEVINTVHDTKSFILYSESIEKAISERVKRHEKELETCLSNVANILKTQAGGDVHKIASLMLSLEMGHNLVNDALVVQAHLERASFLMEEIIDLSCISNNLTRGEEYSVSLEDAKRYGLV